jgi:hypothetical protein
VDPILSALALGTHSLVTWTGTKQSASWASGVKLKNGEFSRSGKPIRADHLRDEVLQVSKTFTDLGRDDPRLNRHGGIDVRLSTLWKGMARDDPAPRRVRPLPLIIIRHVQTEN